MSRQLIYILKYNFARSTGRKVPCRQVFRPDACISYFPTECRPNFRINKIAQRKKFYEKHQVGRPDGTRTELRSSAWPSRLW